VITFLAAANRSSPLTPRSERVYQLRQRKNAFARVALDLFVPEASQERNIVFSNSLGVALLSELTRRAMFVEQECGI
jgi:hypothetical protein